MELYYRDLISEDASLETLVDHLTLMVQGADELAAEAGARLPAEHMREISSRLERLKESCRRIKRQAFQSAIATDKVMRQYPYSSVGFGFAVGMLLGVLLKRRR